ncbi:hypothetical protein EDC96DRAFT_498371, partial [Choanephora cucurbitarum]
MEKQIDDQCLKKLILVPFVAGTHYQSLSLVFVYVNKKNHLCSFCVIIHMLLAPDAYQHIVEITLYISHFFQRKVGYRGS